MRQQITPPVSARLHRQEKSNLVERAGGDGYCGWAQSLHLSARGYDVMIVDNLHRRQYDLELGMDTLTPISSVHERVRTWQAVSGRTVKLEVGDVTNWEFLSQVRPRFLRACVNCVSRRSRLGVDVLPWSFSGRTVMLEVGDVTNWQFLSQARPSSSTLFGVLVGRRAVPAQRSLRHGRLTGSQLCRCSKSSSRRQFGEQRSAPGRLISLWVLSAAGVPRV